MRRTGSEYSTMGGSFDSSKGELRRCNVSAGIGGRSYLAFQKIPKATADFCDWLNGELASVDRNDMAACYRLSFEAHFRLVTIHPWVDGQRAYYPIADEHRTTTVGSYPVYCYQRC